MQSFKATLPRNHAKTSVSMWSQIRYAICVWTHVDHLWTICGPSVRWVKAAHLRSTPGSIPGPPEHCQPSRRHRWRRHRQRTHCGLNHLASGPVDTKNHSCNISQQYVAWCNWHSRIPCLELQPVWYEPSSGRARRGMNRGSVEWELMRSMRGAARSEEVLSETQVVYASFRKTMNQIRLSK